MTPMGRRRLTMARARLLRKLARPPVMQTMGPLPDVPIRPGGIEWIPGSTPRAAAVVQHDPNALLARFPLLGRIP